MEGNIQSEVQERNVTKGMIVKSYRSWRCEIQIKLRKIKTMKGQLWPAYRLAI